MKNRLKRAFDIPPGVATMLIEYRDRIAPKIIGRRPGSSVRHCQWHAEERQETVGYLIASCTSGVPELS